MIVDLPSERHVGRAVRLERAIAPERVASAVRQGAATDEDPEIRVTARRPHPVHNRMGCIHPDIGLKHRTALALAGRARGLATPYDAEIGNTRAELLAVTVPAVDTEWPPETDADEAALAELRESVAEYRGRLAVRRANDLPTEDAAAALEDAAASLTAVETEQIAARQERRRAANRVRSVRDGLERRFRLEDALANRRRDARAALVDRLQPAYAAALRDVPGKDPPADPFEADPVSAALAIARIARPTAPLVLAVDRFDSPADAAAWLDAPVIRVHT